MLFSFSWIFHITCWFKLLDIFIFIFDETQLFIFNVNLLDSYGLLTLHCQILSYLLRSNSLLTLLCNFIQVHKNNQINIHNNNLKCHCDAETIPDANVSEARKREIHTDEVKCKEDSQWNSQRIVWKNVNNITNCLFSKTSKHTQEDRLPKV